MVAAARQPHPCIESPLRCKETAVSEFFYEFVFRTANSPNDFQRGSNVLSHLRHLNSFIHSFISGS